MTAPDDRLTLGPLLRYVDETSAAIWVETAAPATVTVTRGAASATARPFVVHLYDSFTERGGPSSTLFRDTAALAAGLEQVAGAAGGAVIRVQGGTGDYAFDRVLRENSAYYLLGVELEPADRTGESQVIRVRVRQKGATIRSRSIVIVPRAAS